ncbi:unnamed protein product [Ilex paraguariensis]|uniref:PB1-like domain-containing protein n=1 Tax=Ilex paraguariensis TaxID=185542 RepID=A0ABC8RUQ8_9AQUA
MSMSNCAELIVSNSDLERDLQLKEEDEKDGSNKREVGQCRQTTPISQQNSAQCRSTDCDDENRISITMADGEPAAKVFRQKYRHEINSFVGLFILQRFNNGHFGFSGTETNRYSQGELLYEVNPLDPESSIEVNSYDAIKIETSYLTLEFQHGGHFVAFSPVLIYNGGKINRFDNIDPDLMSQIEVDGMVETLGNKKDTGYTVYYMLPNADSEDGLRQLASDNDVLNMFACYEGNDIIRLYVVIEQINEGSRGISTVGDKYDTPTFDYEFNIEYGSTFCDGLPDTMVRYADSFDDLDLLYFYDGVPDGVHSSGLENRSRVDKEKSKIGEECSGVGRGNSFD